MKQLKPYPEYKDSGVKWLGDVPKHWDIRKTKYTFKERVQKGFPNEPLLAATQTKGVVPKSHYETRTVTAQKDFHLLKLVKKGDFVISLRSFQGGIELAHYQGIISPAYTIMIPCKDFFEGYFKHLAKTKLFIKLLTTCVTGIREGQNIDYEILKRNYLPIPTFTEQTTIARFIDFKTAQIAKFIKAKKRMIELLKDQKQAIINDAVTGKIDVATGKPYPKYKDSGVEWLGLVPDGWKALSIKRLVSTKMSDGPHETPKFVDNGIPFVSAEAVYDGKVNLKSRRGDISSESHLEFCKKIKPQKNDIFIVKSGSTTGKSCIIDFEEEFSVWSPLALVRCNNKVLPLFMYYAISSTYFQKQVQDRWSFGTQPNIGMGVLQNLKVLFPLDLKVQKAVLDSINNKIAMIDLTISRAEREIALMQEFRTRLISDVVTGKIDVRGIEIPEIVEVDQSIDESLDESEISEELEVTEAEE